MNANKKITFTVSDRRTKNAVIKKLCKENNIEKDLIYCNEFYDYMEYNNDISITLLSTIYKGIEYSFKYFSGCFNAYMVAKVVDYTYYTNEYNHYIIVDKNNIEVKKFAGWTIGNNIKNAYNKFIKTI